MSNKELFGELGAKDLVQGRQFRDVSNLSDLDALAQKFSLLLLIPRIPPEFLRGGLLTPEPPPSRVLLDLRPDGFHGRLRDLQVILRSPNPGEIKPQASFLPPSKDEIVSLSVIAQMFSTKYVDPIGDLKAVLNLYIRKPKPDAAEVWAIGSSGSLRNRSEAQRLAKKLISGARRNYHLTGVGGNPFYMPPNGFFD